MSELELLLRRQKRACQRDGFPSAVIRKDRLARATRLLVENASPLCDALRMDFGQRSWHQSLMNDIYGALSSLHYATDNLDAWMKDEKRRVPFPLSWTGASASITCQPKGVVGAMATWNFPAWVVFSPLAGIFAAGNRCMIKLPELTPETSRLLQQLIRQYFNEDELAAVTGDENTSERFAHLPFDHLLFTGSSRVGRKVMQAAAANLVPVTLELGGKNPVIIGKHADLKDAARKIVLGKSINVGQVCLAPDYVFIHNNSLNEFIAELERAWQEYFPTMQHNPDYGAVINEKHYRRLQSYLDDARENGGEVWSINPARESFIAQDGIYKLPPTLVINPGDNLRIMQEEIFGPLMALKGYSHIDDAIEYIQDHPHPLALYYFGKNEAELQRVLQMTVSGGVTVNDVIQHIACDDLPFGGAGESGMGRYHGIEGFRTFSHIRSVYRQGRINLMQLSGTVPPYTSRTEKLLERMIRRFVR